MTYNNNHVMQEYLKFLVTYHRFLSFALYCIGFVWFVLSLVKKYYMKQFSLFAWTHVSLLIVVTQSYLIIQNIFEGVCMFALLTVLAILHISLFIIIIIP